jgi:hypothetical protein
VKDNAEVKFQQYFEENSKSVNALLLSEEVFFLFLFKKKNIL